MDEPVSRELCSFISFRDDGTVTAVNSSFADLLGYTAEELVGTSLNRIMTGASRIFYQTHFFPMLRLQGRADEIVLSLLAADGAEVPVFLSAVREEKPRAVNRCAVLPFQQRRQYEEEVLRAKQAAEEAAASNEELLRTKRELEESTRLLDRRLAALEQSRQELAHVSQVLSHDLREPLRKIAWFSELIAEERDVNAARSDEPWLEKIQEACRRADLMLDSLRDFVLLELAEGRFERVDLRELALEQLEAAAAARDVDLTVEADELPALQGVPSQLRLLFGRLGEYMLWHLDPTVAPAVRLTATVVEQNSYRMIPDRYRYEPFARITCFLNWRPRSIELTDSSFDPLTNLRMGDYETGLGLAICRKVAANHNGSIEVDPHSSAGTTFTILLPLRQ